MHTTSGTGGGRWFPRRPAAATARRRVERVERPGAFRRTVVLLATADSTAEPAQQISPREHIERIRRSQGVGTEGGSQSSLVQDLHRSVKLLSGGVYSEDIHFIREILQNAEDAAYPAGVEPAITFELHEEDATSTPGAQGMLIIRINEVGFSQADVTAVCSVGGSTKSRDRGQIGEKGIGYKAVFTVSQRPHIASAGYYFRFDEEAVDGLGYIAPTWVEPFPVAAGPKETVHVLPLKAGKLSFLKEQLRVLRPEPLLFLQKITRVNYVTSGSKLELQKTTRAEIVKVQARRNGVYDSASGYWVWHQQVAVPPSVTDDARKGVTSTRLSVAFPLEKRSGGRGNFYAFLLLEASSPFDFVVNADFVLGLSRESLNPNVPWNRWLLQDVLPCAFLDAFQALLREGAERTDLAYKCIPVEAKKTKMGHLLEFVREAILAKLQCNEVISIWRSSGTVHQRDRRAELPVEQPRLRGQPGRRVETVLRRGDGPAGVQLALPSECVFFPTDLEMVFCVLEAAPSLPNWFKDWHIVHPGLSRKHQEAMKGLNVKAFTEEDFAHMMLTDVAWVRSLPEDLYVSLLLEGVPTQVTPLPVIAAHLEALQNGHEAEEATEAQVKKIYQILDEQRRDSPMELHQLFEERKLVLFAGAWRSPSACFWHLNKGAFRDDFVALSDEYPQRRKFFVGKIQVRRQPEAADYAERWLRICKSGVQPPDEEMWLVWCGILGDDCAKKILEQGDCLLPTVGKRLRPPGEVVVADAEAWAAFGGGARFPGFGFAWPGPHANLPAIAAFHGAKQMLADTFAQLGAARCPENLRIQDWRGGDPMFPNKNLLLTKELFGAIDLWQRARIAKVVDRQALADFKETREVIHEELLVFILSASKGEELARVDVPQMAHWSREKRLLHLRAPVDGRICMALQELIASNLVLGEDAFRIHQRCELSYFIGNLLSRSADVVNALISKDTALARLTPKAKLSRARAGIGGVRS